MSESQIVAHKPLVKASTELGQFLGMETPMMIDAIKSQAFKGKTPDQVTDAQLATYISTANALKLNPLLPGQMYAFPDRQGGGVTVMIGPDGVFTLLSNNPNIVAQKDGGPAWWTEHGKDADGKDTCTGYINHARMGLMKKTIWVDEWVVPNNPNWVQRRKHLSEIRALKQTARMVIHGLPVDSDEHKLGEMLNVTESAEQAAPAATVTRAEPPARARKGASAVKEPAAIEVATTTVTEAAKVVTPEPAKVAEVVATPAPEKVAEKVVTPEPAPEPAAAEPAAAPAPVARAFLKDGEEIIGVCTVEKVSGLIINKAGVPTPSVQAQVKGAFNGVVYHIGGGKKVGDAVEPDGAWANGVDLKLTLLGKLNTKAGKIQVWVQKAEASADEAVIEA